MVFTEGNPLPCSSSKSPSNSTLAPPPPSLPAPASSSPSSFCRLSVSTCLILRFSSRTRSISTKSSCSCSTLEINRGRTDVCDGSSLERGERTWLSCVWSGFSHERPYSSFLSLKTASAPGTQLEVGLTAFHTFYAWYRVFPCVWKVYTWHTPMGQKCKKPQSLFLKSNHCTIRRWWILSYIPPALWLPYIALNKRAERGENERTSSASTVTANMIRESTNSVLLNRENNLLSPWDVSLVESVPVLLLLPPLVVVVVVVSLGESGSAVLLELFTLLLFSLSTSSSSSIVHWRARLKAGSQCTQRTYNNTKWSAEENRKRNKGEERRPKEECRFTWQPVRQLTFRNESTELLVFVVEKQRLQT